MRYGSFKYGSGVKYGATAASNTLSWGFQVDWNDDEVFDGSNEAEWMMDLFVGRGRDNYLNQITQGEIIGFERVGSGSGNVTLINVDGRYDPFNTDSPLYPNVAPGKLCKIRVKDNATGTIYPIIAGRIKDITPISGSDKVLIDIEDGLNDLLVGEVTIAIQESVNIDDAIALVLSDISYFWGSSIGNSTDTLQYWWAEGEPHANACMDLAEADLGVFYIAADGSATFIGRNTINDVVLEISQGDILKEIPVKQPWETLRDLIKVLVYPRLVAATADLWQLQDIPLISPGETKIFWTNFTYGDTAISVPAKNILAPVATTDYTMNTLSTGLGTDLTADFSVTAYNFSTTSRLTVTNNGATAGYVTLLKQRGDPVYSPDTTIIKSGSGRRLFTLDSKWIQQVANGEAFADAILDLLSSTLKFPTVQFESRPDIQFIPDLFSAIQVNIEKLVISGQYSAGNISHKWLSSNGQVVLTRIGLEPFTGFSGGWQFPVDLGVDSIFAL